MDCAHTFLVCLEVCQSELFQFTRLGFEVFFFVCVWFVSVI